ncbi:MaoC family dehydratase N-terminal domain-containing protein [Saccharopolyspora oryzae]|uniref:MaoC family dehydratase N-terminal domain-containing protein n=1 Tax=Saccharopolyspora oryzae TaxID=2997343 RepID=A0ABT4V029_9PSEU|nr:MaoC family dehydratase N-terminal domain-containing protein [Saccharopolyspora oryzae]MDA3626657.1 MaoC family dehydratase N-terminal domain-containing protein [Saccharopolyspora oryzae]
MAINREFVGFEFSAGEAYEVTRGKIREFAEAIGDPNPAYRSVDAARELGHPDVIAPPTFGIVAAGAAAESNPIRRPEFGLNMRLVVHGEQKFRYERPIRAGDVLTASGRIAEIRDAGQNELVRVETEIRDAGGDLVCTATNVIVSRGTAAGAGE